MPTNTCAIDDTMYIGNASFATCHWCDGGGPMYRYATNHEGVPFWSVPLCSVTCHDEFYSDDNWSLPVG